MTDEKNGCFGAGTEQDVSHRILCFCVKTGQKKSNKKNFLLLQNHLNVMKKISIGAENGTRTRHLQLGRLSLYRMSYFRIKKTSGRGRIRTSEGLASRFTVCPI